MWIWSLGREDPLEEGMATHSSVLAWRIPTDRGAWWATVHGVAKNGPQLKWLSTHAEHLQVRACSPENWVTLVTPPKIADPLRTHWWALLPGLLAPITIHRPRSTCLLSVLPPECRLRKHRVLFCHSTAQNSVRRHNIDSEFVEWTVVSSHTVLDLWSAKSSTSSLHALSTLTFQARIIDLGAWLQIWTMYHS